MVTLPISVIFAVTNVMLSLRRRINLTGFGMTYVIEIAPKNL
jgi:hypothetical protein